MRQFWAMIAFSVIAAATTLQQLSTDAMIRNPLQL